MGKNEKSVILTIVMLLTISVICWQVPNEIERTEATITGSTQVAVEMEWNTTFGGISDDGAYFSIQTSEGGFALAGFTGSYGAGGGDMWLVKTDADGQHEWNSTFGGTGDEFISSLIQTSDGGFVLTGGISSYGAGGSDMWLVKTDADGQHEWNSTFGGTGEDRAHSLIQTADGGFVLAGATNSWDPWLVKANSTGHMEWNTTFGGTGLDGIFSIIQTADGGFVLVGTTSSYGVGFGDMWLVKMDADGQHEWNTTFGGIGVDGAFSFIQTADGGFVIAGATYSYGAGGSDMWLVKTDSTGHMEWNTTFGGTDDDEAYSLIQTSDGGFVLVGTTNSYGAGGSDIWLVKTDTDGQHEWNTTFGGTGEDIPHSIIQISDDGFVLAGITNSYGAGGSDMWLVKTLAHKMIPPVILTPDGGVFTETMNIIWNPANDSYQHPIKYDLFYSNDNGINWDIIVSDISGTTYNWDISTFPNGSAYQIKLITRCSAGAEVEVSSSPFAIENNINSSTTHQTSSSWSFSVVVMIGIVFCLFQKKRPKDE